VALVTGGARGIGRAIVLALAGAGAAVAATARSGPALAAVLEQARAAGAPATWALPLDLARPDVAGIVDDVARRAGPVDLLVNNAGVAESAPVARTSLEHWQQHLAVNATGPFLLIRALLPGMLARGWGRIVNVASIVGLEGAPYTAAYAASKHALVGLTRVVAAETAGTGVTCNAVCPGYVATELTWASARRIEQRTGRSYDDAVAALAARNRSGRLVEPAAVARAVLELAADPDRNGQTLVLD
jgi:NAD(P)-dependent dehydrogenase (short-subunit alcohol dehydrogenase family)